MAGQRIGLIMFGSRVDHFLPLEYQVAVKLGDRVRAGESVIGERTLMNQTARRERKRHATMRLISGRLRERRIKVTAPLTRGIFLAPDHDYFGRPAGGLLFADLRDQRAISSSPR